MPQAPLLRSGAGRQPPTPQAWEAVKAIVQQLYDTEERTLREVKDYLEEHHGFRASERMFKDRLRKWGFFKNLTREDWIGLAVLYAGRKASGKRSTQFNVRERRKTLRDLQKYSRSHGVNEDTLAARAGPDIDIPNYLRAVTPESDASHVNSSPSEDSFRTTQSPKGSPVRSASGIGTEAYVRRPVCGDLLSTASVESGFDWSQGGLAFAPLASHDLQFRHGLPGSLLYSHISSGSASLAMTGSTMATSISSGDNAIAIPSSSREAEPGGQGPCAENALASSWSLDSVSIPSSCDNLSREIELMSHQITDPAPLRSRYGAEDINAWMLLDAPKDGEDPSNLVCSCSVCHQPSSTHFVSIHNAAPQERSRNILNEAGAGAFELPPTMKEEGAWKWIALCFASCLNLTRSNSEIADQLLEEASAAFELLLIRRDPMLLTAANQMISILHMHSQGAIATKITQSAKTATDRLLPPADPVKVTIDYLAATADSSSSTALKESGITSDVLRDVYTQFNEDPDYGSQHPYTIAAAYNHSWLLRYDGHNKESEQELHRVYEMSCSIFSKHHMQSITALATLAGTQSGQKKTKEAMANYKKVIRDCEPTLGKNHPYRLEGMRRLALQYREQGRPEKMVPLYWDVLVGRVRMLGPKHKYTLGQKEDYEKLMTELGRWNPAAQDQVERLFASDSTAQGEAMQRRRSESHSSDEIRCEAY